MHVCVRKRGKVLKRFGTEIKRSEVEWSPCHKKWGINFSTHGG
jgi:hypothetical protein